MIGPKGGPSGIENSQFVEREHNYSSKDKPHESAINSGVSDQILTPKSQVPTPLKEESDPEEEDEVVVAQMDHSQNDDSINAIDIHSEKYEFNGYSSRIAKSEVVSNNNKPFRFDRFIKSGDKV